MNCSGFGIRYGLMQNLLLPDPENWKTLNQMKNCDRRVVNNAGALAEKDDTQPIWDFAEAHFDEGLDDNVRGTMLEVKYAAKQIIGQAPLESGSRGCIANMGSVYAKLAKSLTVNRLKQKNEPITVLINK